MDRDVDLIAVAGQRFVDRVVDDLVDEVMQARRTGRADVHRRPLAHGLEPFENLDLVGAVIFVDGHTETVAIAGRSCRRIGRFGIQIRCEVSLLLFVVVGGSSCDIKRFTSARV